MASSHRSLQGLKLLLTRPSHQAEEWHRAFSLAGADVCHIPTMEIVPHVPDSEQRDYLNSADMGIFVSTNAVRALKEFLEQAAKAMAPIPWLAVGAKTAEYAQAAGFELIGNTDSKKGPIDSDTLLALPELASDKVRDRQVVIIRGLGGREKLAETLKSRGAMVNYCELYKRQCAWKNSEQLSEYLLNVKPDLISVSSVDSLNHIFSMAEAEGKVKSLQSAAMLVPGQRVALAACEKGIEQPVISRSMRLSDVLYASEQWWLGRQSGQP